MHVATITIDHLKVAGDLTDYVVAIVPNSDAGWAQLYAIATEGGGDIRIFKAGGVTEIPREKVSFSVSAETGEIHAKITGTTSGSVDTDIEIHADGTSSDYVVGATYGRNAVWSAYEFVSHDGGKTDSTGNYTFTANGGVDSSSGGILGDKSTFDGAGDFYNTSDNSLIPVGANPVSLSVWVKRNGDQGSNDGIFYHDGERVFFQYASASTLLFGIGDGSSFYYPSAVSNTNAVWEHFIGVNNPSASKIQLYKNGSLGSETTPATNSMSSGTGDFKIGRQANDTRQYTGDLDEVRILHDIYSTSWIATEHDNQDSPTTFYSVAAESGGAVQNSNFLMFM